MKNVRWPALCTMLCRKVAHVTFSMHAMQDTLLAQTRTACHGLWYFIHISTFIIRVENVR